MIIDGYDYRWSTTSSRVMTIVKIITVKTVCYAMAPTAAVIYHCGNLLTLAVLLDHRVV